MCDCPSQKRAASFVPVDLVETARFWGGQLFFWFLNEIDPQPNSLNFIA
jgi:hypothetical protein